jgi:ribosome-binding factor A
MSSNRNRRVEDAIRDELQHIFLSEVSDPRLPAMFTVLRVEAAKDLRNATVYFSQLPDSEKDVREALDMLADSAGYLRALLSQSMTIRHVPALHFRYDPGQKNYHRINKVITQLRAKGELKDEPASSSPEAPTSPSTDETSAP